jgi:uncharacterized protein
VRFWDSSAIVPVIVEEARSPACRQLLRADSGQVVWSLTRTEVLSALWRQCRSGLLAIANVQRAEGRLQKLAARWVEICALDEVRDEAERLLRIHPVRAADALQLAAARIWAQGRPRGRAFVGLDEGLLDAAAREGFDVVKPAG